jgi:hypothetical protein
MTQAYNLSQLANNLNSAGRLDATDGLVNAVPVANGGTGASSVASAVANLSASIYPIGSIYINAGVTTNPATLLGFGTWTAFGAGRVLVGLNASDSAFDTLQETGGSKDAIVVSHTHAATSVVTDPGHNHDPSVNGNTLGFQTNGPDVYNVTRPNLDQGPFFNMKTGTSATGITVATTNSTAGSSGTNGNLQPYITVCMWLRIN